MRAKYVSVACVEGQRLQQDQWVWPMQVALGMGFSWATFLTQQCNVHNLQQSLPRSIVTLLTGRGEAWVLRRGAANEAHYVYIDSF